MRRRAAMVVAGIVVVLAGLAVAFVLWWGPALNIWVLPPTPQQFGDAALSRMDRSVYADSDDWKKRRPELAQQVRGATSREEVLFILRGPLRTVGGPHSRIYPLVDSAATSTDDRRPSVSVDQGIATVRLPGYSGDLDGAQEYADIVAEGLRDSGACGVILDLREHNGGSGLAALPGLAALLPDGEMMGFVVPPDLETVRQRTTLKDGVFDTEGLKFSAPAAVEKLDLPVALLTGQTTASAGEQLVLEFRGLPYTRSFGAKTYGVPTGPQHFAVYDTVFQVTVALPKDRDGRVYWDEPLSPDVEVAVEEAEDAARSWLREQGCSAQQ